MTIRVGIMGYGNIGRGIEDAISDFPDMELVAVFTRRNPDTVRIRTSDAPVVSVRDMAEWADKVDVLVLAGGSATDLPRQTPEYARLFNVIDTFDTHATIPEHFAAVDKAAKESSHVAMISVGWDPGLFSLARLYGNAILPNGRDYTFWGRGVSQGHSDAIRRVKGVKNGKEYTCPVEKTVESVRNGETPELAVRDKHTRECFVVLEDGADPAQVEREIKTMPHYFDEYDTTVHFISEEEFNEKHQGLAHGGLVFRSGVTGESGEHKEIIEFKLTLDSNPEFTSHVVAAFARAIARLRKEGASGCKTVFDIPPAYLSQLSGDELRRTLL